MIFYRSSSFVSNILSELRQLNSHSTEFSPSFISFGIQYWRGEMAVGLKRLISTQQGIKEQNSWATWYEMCHPQVNRLQPLQPLPMVNPEETLRSSHPLFSRELWNGQLEIVAEKWSILIPCWNCFFDLLFDAFVIIIIQNGLPQRILPLCMTIKLKCLCSELCPPVDGRKEKIKILPVWG